MAKKEVARVLVIIYVASIIVAGEASTALSSKSLQSSAKIQHYEVFVNHQPDRRLEVPLKDNFIYVPGLNEAFHVQRNTLFKITVQASLQSFASSDIYVQLIVNGYIIIGNKLIPNTVQRVDYGVGNNLYEVDIMGGYFFGNGISVPVTRVAFIYLRPGVYSFNVGVRTAYNTGWFYRGMVTYELTQYECEHINLVGNYNLTSIPS